jgi:hypothetical protein
LSPSSKFGALPFNKAYLNCKRSIFARSYELATGRLLVLSTVNSFVDASVPLICARDAYVMAIYKSRPESSTLRWLNLSDRSVIFVLLS